LTRQRLSHDVGILLVLVGIALGFEGWGWSVRGTSFLLSGQRLLVMVLQVSIIGLLAIGVTQVILTGGIDLSSGSVVALSAMTAASLARAPTARAVFPSLTDLPVVVPIAAGLATGAVAGLVNGSLIAYTGIPPFIATLGMMVSARGLARYYTRGQPVSMLTEDYTRIGEGALPVFIFLVTAIVFHVLLRHTRYGRYTYALGANAQAARVSGIRVNRHLMFVYTTAGLLSGLGGVVTAARAASGQAAVTWVANRAAQRSAASGIMMGPGHWHARHESRARRTPVPAPGRLAKRSSPMRRQQTRLHESRKRRSSWPIPSSSGRTTLRTTWWQRSPAARSSRRTSAPTGCCLRNSC
jgi:inositol transport system permease protein